ncbi:helix-turn-helix domain-containing protein [Massilia sp. PAMC28688]|uniref:GlxA family transcriptional regulator n=1 Tax=Massilia sp. PAMC28688 TaxID=2861283 RepID=UPI001C624AF9|nr:helix-turn-helix domain-containing protein [Massilia sp. PAMC28688]QYF94139.1 helix-turn-helix domain-containing protein [Massilia sp. PAMC28688]
MTKHIAILAYEGCMGMEVFGLCDTLLMANRVAAALGHAGPLFQVAVLGMLGESVAAAGGFRIGTRRASRRLKADLLVVPGMELADRASCLRPLTHLAAEAAYLDAMFARGIPVAATCVGAFLLGEAGLLDGRRATTSWLFAPDLALRFPHADVQAAAMLVSDGGVTTTGSFSAAFDLAMDLVRQSAPPRVLRAVARMAMLDENRTSQAPYIDARMMAPPAAGFGASVRAWIDHRLAEPYDLQRLADSFHVSPRTLLRRFKDDTGATPLGYLQRARVDKARLLLESTTLAVAQVTGQVGYGDVATFSTLFKRLVGHTPAEYRRRFRTGPA